MELLSPDTPQTVTTHSTKTVFIKTLLFSFCIVLAMYITLTLYFVNHFYFGTTINGVDVSGQHIKDVNVIMSTELSHYRLKITERNGKEETITGKDIGLSYQSGGNFKQFKDKQLPFLWFSSLFNDDSTQLIDTVFYNHALLEETIDDLDCFNDDFIIEPKNPSFTYINNTFDIVPEENGNKINRTLFTNYVCDALLKRQPSINLESLDCYIKPTYHSKSEKVVLTHQLLNQYAATNITYTFGNDTEVLDGSTINKWLTVDAHYTIRLNKEYVKNYVETLAEEYNTIGKKRRFSASLGKEIIVSGGDYGGELDTATETDFLLETIHSGQMITREPAYIASAMSRGKNDIGKTYVEISLKNQHLWFYKDGQLISEGPIVTGNISANHTTPSGIYKLKYKCKNVVLRGPGYAAPVSFWMPFNGGIGIHDANWRRSFGGTIYKTGGSHGCINCPYSLAKAIYNNIEVGTPIICYN